MDGFLDFFDPQPLLSHMWIILLNKGYVLMWIFREPPSPLGHPHGLWMFPYDKSRCTMGGGVVNVF